MDRHRAIFVAFAVICFVAIANKIRRGRTTFGAAQFHRSAKPIQFWAMIAFDLSLVSVVVWWNLVAKRHP